MKGYAGENADPARIYLSIVPFTLSPPLKLNLGQWLSRWVSRNMLIYFWLTRASPSRSERTRSDLNWPWLVGSSYDIIRAPPERDEVMSPSYMSHNWSAHYAGYILGTGRIRWLVAIVNRALILALTYPKGKRLLVKTWEFRKRKIEKKKHFNLEIQ